MHFFDTRNRELNRWQQNDDATIRDLPSNRGDMLTSKEKFGSHNLADQRSPRFQNRGNGINRLCFFAGSMVEPERLFPTTERVESADK
tara:strand:+ start:758 stop:1021 length:264 start_codon:yes stop_codon:yes gene_type:complete